MNVKNTATITDDNTKEHLGKISFFHSTLQGEKVYRFQKILGVFLSQWLPVECFSMNFTGYSSLQRYDTINSFSIQKTTQHFFMLSARSSVISILPRQSFIEQTDV